MDNPSINLFFLRCLIVKFHPDVVSSVAIVIVKSCYGYRRH
jgi:hypothetical protein